MKDFRQVILRPIISEKSYDLVSDNRYTFEVAKTSNKIEIRQAVEAIFDVTVLNVNTMSVKGKPKRVRQAKGYTRSWKKAIVTLAEGDTIEAFGA
jgi:large subunit ribosomal protein L23